MHRRVKEHITEISLCIRRFIRTRSCHCARLPMCGRCSLSRGRTSIVALTDRFGTC